MGRRNTLKVTSLVEYRRWRSMTVDQKLKEMAEQYDKELERLDAELERLILRMRILEAKWETESK